MLTSKDPDPVHTYPNVGASGHLVSSSAWMSSLRSVGPGPQFDPSVPHSARVYGYWLGGKDHYTADREAAEEVIQCRPQVIAGARANRAFLARVVRYLATECGIRQFIDIGTGLPAPGNTHEVAQDISPDCRIVYVDNDPLVLTYARALLTSGPQGSCDYLDADLRDASSVLAGASATLDFTRPAAVLLLAVLHFIADSDDPATIVAALASKLAPGSYLVISHLTADFAPGPVATGVAAYNAMVPTTLTARTHSQVSALFGGLPLVAPGVVPLTEWRPATADPLPHTADLYAAVARTPGGRQPKGHLCSVHGCGVRGALPAESELQGGRRGALRRRLLPGDRRAAGERLADRADALPRTRVHRA
jgi:SAM-dependent methyltransferase